MRDVFIARVFASILVSLLVGLVFLTRGASQIDVLSETDKADIVISLLRLEAEAPGAQFERIRSISSENIDFVPLERITKEGVALLTAYQIEHSRRDHVIEYVAIKSISYSRNGVVAVRVSRVVEGRPCFSPAFSGQRSFTYEFTYQSLSRTWAGRLVRKPLPFSLVRPQRDEVSNF